jgi:lipoate-protein ligase A
MHWLDHSLATPEGNLAWDEALIEIADASAAEANPSDGNSEGAWSGLEVLRVWEMPQPCVVLGRSSRIDEEVRVDRCRADGVRILRRMSGGATIVAGPGCLMYSALLSLDARPECRALDAAHRMVMGNVRDAVRAALATCGFDWPVEIQGICDLTLHGRKISGNSLRVKRHWMMYHGTLLVTMPTRWISDYLKSPPKQPEYRERRPHEDFVGSLEDVVGAVPDFPNRLKTALSEAWKCDAAWRNHPWQPQMAEQVAGWLERRYRDLRWHRSR